MTAYTLSQIAAKLGGEVRGADIAVTAVAPAARAGADEITFLANPKYRHEVEASAAGAVIVGENAADGFAGRSLIVARDPYLYFAQVARLFHPVQAARAGVHPTAVIEPTATARWSSTAARSATTPCCTPMPWFITAARSARGWKSTAAR